MLASKLTTSLVGGSSSAPTSDEVFSTYLYTGNVSTQTINNGIALDSSDAVYVSTRAYATNQFTDFTSVALDSANNVYVVGANRAGQEGQLTKFDSTGTSVVWSKTFLPGGSGNYLHSIHIDESDNIFVSGFNDQSGTNNKTLLVYKITSSGSLVWGTSVTFSGTQSPGSTNKIKTDSVGNVYITGSVYKTYETGFLTKLNSSGTLQWTQYRVGGGSGANFNSIEIDGSNNIYVCGNSYRNSGASQQGCIWKFDSSGNQIASQFIYNADRYNIVYDLKFNANRSRLYFCGVYQNASGINIGYITYTDSNISAFYSVKTFTKASTDIRATSISVDSNGYVYTSITETNAKVHIVKLDSSGQLVNASLMEGNSSTMHFGYSQPRCSITVTPTNVYIPIKGTPQSGSYGFGSLVCVSNSCVASGSTTYVKFTKSNDLTLTSGGVSGGGNSDSQVETITTSSNTAGGMNSNTFAVSDYSSIAPVIGSGGMVWCKSRSAVNSHVLVDTERGATKFLITNNSDAQGSWGSEGVTSFNSNGYSIGNSIRHNNYSESFASWTFRRAPKFFDVVTYTGDGVAGRQIAHSLGVAPGMIIVKRTDAADPWLVYHRSAGGINKTLTLNDSTAVQTYDPPRWHTTPTSSSFYLEGSGYGVNNSGATYVAYLFAHDTSTDGIIQCGSFTTDAGGNATVNLGWEPQYVMVKSAGTSGDWIVLDTMRGWTNPDGSKSLSPNLSSAEGTRNGTYPTATGFQATGTSSSTSHIYLAIRRPNKPPTTGTQVYNAIARTGTGAAATVTGVGFAPDLFISRDRISAVSASHYFIDKLRGTGIRDLKTDSTAIEGSSGSDGVSSFDMSGVSLSSAAAYNSNTVTYINHFFKRAVGCFDVVCYTGTGSATTIPHSLGVVPELMIVKRRDTAFSWYVYHKDMAATDALILNDTLAKLTGTDAWGNTRPTATVFSPSNTGSNSTNAAASMYVNYLWATKAGISKVGNFTGNGGTQTIDMGFSTGARFFLVKATSTTGSWWIFDSVRGVVSAADPALQLNSTAAEITSADAVDPDASGIIVNQEATCSINAIGVSYVYLAFA